MPPADPSPSRRLLVPAIKLLVVVAVMWFIWDTLRTGLADLDRGDWRADYRWLAGTGVLYLVGLLPAGLFWHRVLLSLGQRPSLAATLRAYIIGHLGKYTPGKVLVPVIRSNLLAKQGVGMLTGWVSVIIETLTMMGVGAAVAAAMGIVIFHDQPRMWIGSLLMVAVFGLPTLPPFVNGLLRRKLGQLLSADRQRASANHEPTGTEKSALPVDGSSNGHPNRPSGGKPPDSAEIPRISWRLAFSGWVLNVLGWGILGLSLWAMLRSLVPADLAPVTALPHYTAAVALALVAGFLSGLPGGIGVRDGVLVATLARIVPDETALVATVLLRVVWLISEVAISAILYVGGERLDGWRSPRR